MALYHNGTRFAAIVTIRVSAVQDPQKAFEIGTPSTMKVVGVDLGVHDLLVEPGESIQSGPGVEAEFLAARGA
ncbi:hypothetical protein [Nannocystis sp.]|uniref:hypothetical protein n=1 Tax=Nannocystis sp. TaxID=1962667 RepID=UPI0025F95A8E|nr:hypothetical protein [Nannocystis sp.]MBK7830558.1 hypothetical protein [Nannocystis sp.]